MEEYLEQLKSDESFYARIASDLTALESFPISREEKKKIWFEIYLTAQNYEASKRNGSVTKNLCRIADIFGEIGNDIIKIGEINHSTQQSAHIARINQQITDAKIKYANANIERISKKEKEIEKLNNYTARKLEDTEQTIGEIKEELGYEEEFDGETKSEKELASERKSILEKISKNMRNQEN